MWRLVQVYNFCICPNVPFCMTLALNSLITLHLIIFVKGLFRPHSGMHQTSRKKVGTLNPKKQEKSRKSNEKVGIFQLNNAHFNHYFNVYWPFIRMTGLISLENKPNTGHICVPLPIPESNIKESNGVGAGGVSPRAPRRFFKFQVLNGAILALFFYFFYLFN